MSIAMIALKVVVILILAPIVGGLLAGLDRIISARMQSRKGPPLFQPFYDVIKLWQKEPTAVSPTMRLFVTLSMLVSMLTVVMFCLGLDLLLCIFAFTLACIFFAIAGYTAHSPYSYIGTERELLQIMCYEPMILILAFGYYQVVGSFNVSAVLQQEAPLIIQLPLIFLGLMFVLTIKLRKSPFDLSMSHHGHQEIVKGITTEINGKYLAMVEITHWFETIFALGLVFLFFAFNSTTGIIVAVVLCIFIYFLEILVDNTFARARWKAVLATSWIFVAITSGLNLMMLNLPQLPNLLNLLKV